MQAEFVRIPYADTSLYPIPEGANQEELVMLSDILPTGFECGVLNDNVKLGGTVAIVGAGPIGLASHPTHGPVLHPIGRLERRDGGSPPGR